MEITPGLFKLQLWGGKNGSKAVIILLGDELMIAS